MELKEFDTQMDRLRATYGEKAYPKAGEREKAIWDRVKAFPAKQLEAALTSVIGDTFTAPPVSRIVDAAVSARTEVTFLTSGPSPHNCPACSDTGIGHVEDRVEKCICPAGAKISPAKLHQLQKDFDRGRELFPSPFDKERATASRSAPLPDVFPSLPYNPRERGSA